MTDISDERAREIIDLYWRLTVEGGEAYAAEKIRIEYGLTEEELRELLTEYPKDPQPGD